MSQCPGRVQCRKGSLQHPLGIRVGLPDPQYLLASRPNSGTQRWWLYIVNKSTAVGTFELLQNAKTLNVLKHFGAIDFTFVPGGFPRETTARRTCEQVLWTTPLRFWDPSLTRMNR